MQRSIESWKKAELKEGLFIAASKVERNIILREQVGVAEDADVPVLSDNIYEVSDNFSDQDFNGLLNLIGQYVKATLVDGRVTKVVASDSDQIV